MEKLDLRKILKAEYNPPRTPQWITIPAANFLMIDGKGNPNTAPAYMDALQALYGLSYTLKFQLKKDLELDYTVMGLEGLWWVPDMNDFTVENKDAWLWTMMIRQPDQVTPEQFERARVDVIKKKGEGSYKQVRLERFEEGLCAQVMHIGPYAAEAPTIQALHAFIAAAGRTRRGKHHEIYLGDPRRTDPAKLRTILRQPAE